MALLSLYPSMYQMRESYVKCLSREISGLHPGAGQALRVENEAAARVDPQPQPAGSVNWAPEIIAAQRKPHVNLYKNERWNKFPVLIFTAIMITIGTQTSEYEWRFRRQNWRFVTTESRMFEYKLVCRYAFSIRQDLPKRKWYFGDKIAFVHARG